MKKFIGFIGIVLLLSGCAEHSTVSKNFTESIKTKKTATLVAPDTHIVEVAVGGDIVEHEVESKKGSQYFLTELQKQLSNYYIVKNISESYCPLTKTDIGNNENNCSKMVLDLRQLGKNFETLSDSHKVYAKALDLPKNTDITIYLYALEPNRSVGSKVASGLFTAALAVATAGTFTTVASAMEDTVYMVMIDNKTKELLWYDKQIGGSIDLDEKDEVAESIQGFVKNIKLYRKKQ